MACVPLGEFHTRGNAPSLKADDRRDASYNKFRHALPARLNRIAPAVREFGSARVGWVGIVKIVGLPVETDRRCAMIECKRSATTGRAAVGYLARAATRIWARACCS